MRMWGQIRLETLRTQRTQAKRPFLTNEDDGTGWSADLLLLALLRVIVRFIVAGLVGFDGGHRGRGAAATLEAGQVALEHVDLSLLLILAHRLVLLGLWSGRSHGATHREGLLVIHDVRAVLLHKLEQHKQHFVGQLINVQLNLGFLSTLDDSHVSTVEGDGYALPC